MYHAQHNTTQHNTTGKFLIFSLMCYLSLFPFEKLLAQKPLFEPTKQPTVLNEAQQKILNYLNSLTSNSGLHFAKFNPLDEIKQGDNSVSIILEGESEPIKFQIINFEFNAENDYRIIANSEYGELIWEVRNYGHGGSIDLINRYFKIYPFGKEEVVIMEQNSLREPNIICKSQDINDRNGENSERSLSFCNSSDCGTAQLDIVALVTPAARTWIDANMGWYASYFILSECQNINAAFVSSGIPNKSVRVRFEDFTPDFTLSANIDNDNASMQASNKVRNAQARYRADIVLLLTNQTYLVSNVVTFGIANTFDPSASKKYCIVEVPFINSSRFTAAHEIAHQLNCRHDTDNSGEKCAKGFTLASPVNRKTIMGTSASSFNLSLPQITANTRIQHFSNPNIIFGGVATGTANNNNAAMIRASFCTAANNLPDASIWDAPNLTAPWLCDGSPMTSAIAQFYADLYQPIPTLSPYAMNIIGKPPYTYSWKVYKNFSATPEYIGTNVYFSFTALCGKIYDLYLKIQSSDNQTINRYVRVDMTAGCTCKTTAPASLKFNDQISEIEIYPNPVEGVLKITVPTTVEPNGIKLVNQSGQIVKVIDISNTSEINVLEIPNGIYSISYFDRIEGQKSKLIVINH